MAEGNQKACVRKDAKQCPSCRHNVTEGEPYEPLVMVKRGKKDEVIEVDCLSYRGK